MELEYRMRYFLTFFIFVLWMPAPLYAGEVLDSLQMTEKLMKLGAKEVALAKIQREQSDLMDVTRWMAWENLHITLLADLGRHTVLLKRMEQLSVDKLIRLHPAAYGLAANSALQLKQPEKSREFIRQQLWVSALPPMDIKSTRYLLIESFLEGKPAAAYQALLKYQQDYGDPDAQQLRRLLKLLLLSGMEKEALTWLPRLQEADPLKSWIRLKAGLMAPEAALVAAKLSLQKGVIQENWFVIWQAATMLNHAGERLGAREQLLNTQILNAAEQQLINIDTLWVDYSNYAQTQANLIHLLTGDDASWVAQATQWSGSAPLNARAFWAYLSEHAIEPSTRERARSELYLSLLEAHMGTTMLKLAKHPANSQKVEDVTLKHLQVLGTPVQQQEMLLAQAQFAAAQGEFGQAADFALQGTMLREDEALDGLTLQLYAFALDSLNQAGWINEVKFVQVKLAKQRLLQRVPLGATP